MNINNNNLRKIREKRLAELKKEYARQKEHKAWSMWSKVISRRAAKRYTLWGNKAQYNLAHGKNNPRASLNRKMMLKHMTPKNYKEPLYRGIKNGNISAFMSRGSVVNRPTFSSFTKNKNVASRFTNQNNRTFLVIQNPTHINSIHYGRNGYSTYHKSENEVLLPPGQFTVTGKRVNGNNTFIYVNFKRLA